MNNVSRVIFKAPGMVFFRRCLFVHSVEVVKDRMIVKHGVFGLRSTSFPIDGSVIRMVHKAG